MKMENPRMNFVLKLFRLQNWSRLRPPAPDDRFLQFSKKSNYYVTLASRNVPTYAKNRQ